MAQQHLDDANVDLLLQQVGGEAVAQDVGRHALVDLGCISCLVDSAVELTRSHRVDRVQPGDEPAIAANLALGMTQTPPGAKTFQQHRAEHGIAILEALASRVRQLIA